MVARGAGQTPSASLARAAVEEGNAAWFRSVVQHAADVVTVTRDGRIVYASESVHPIIGYRPDEIIGREGMELVHRDDVAAARRAGAQAQRNGTSDPVLLRVRHHDGSWRTFESQLTCLLADPAVRGIVTSSRDVTEREHDLRTLRARARVDAFVAELSSTLVRATPDDVDGLVAEALARLAEVVGADAAVLECCDDDGRSGGFTCVWYDPSVGPPPDDLGGADSRGAAGDAEAASAFLHTFAGVAPAAPASEAPGSPPAPLRAVGGFAVSAPEHAGGSVTLVWRARSPEIDAEGLEPYALLGASLISTVARARAEVSARGSEERFRSIAEHSSDFVLVYGADGRVKYLNPPAARFTGFELGSAVVPSPFLHHPEDGERVRAEFAAIVRSGGTGASSPPFEARVRRCDGEYRWLELIGTNLLDDPVVGGVVINARDVTERRAMEQELRDSELRFRALVQNVAEGITVLGADGAIRYASPSGSRMLGYREGEAEGSHPLELVHPEDQPAIAGVLARAFAEPGIHGPVSLRVRAADGSWRNLEALGNNLLDDPAVEGVVITARDVTERFLAEEALRRSDTRLAALVENLSDVITVVGAEGRLVYSSPAAERLFGFVEGDESWTNPLARVHPDDVERVAAEFGEQLAGGPPGPVRFRLRVADGSWHHVESVLRDMSDDAAVGGIVVTTRDVTDRMRAEGLVADQARVLRLIAQGAPLDETLTTMCTVVEGYVADARCSVLLVDEAANVLRPGAGPRIPPGLAREIAEVPIGPEQGSCGAAAFQGEPVVVEDVTVDPRWAGHVDVALEHGVHACWSTPIFASSGERVLGTFALYFDQRRGPTMLEEEVVAMITALGAIAIERKGTEDRLAHQAHHDPLTVLPNRVLFVEFLTLALARAQRQHSAVAVLFLDLDRFKHINDKLGHDSGDAFLVKLADRLRGVVRPGDTVARFGGDEFTVLCDDLTVAEARRQATEVAQRLLDVIEVPMDLDGEPIHLSASIGIAIARPGDQPEALLRDADTAMYRAKERGKGRWEVFDEEMRSSVQVRLETESALYRALDRSELRIFYQPIVALDGGRCVGAEALVRWEHPERGLVTPDEFIELAEETGLIVPMGSWVLDEACRTVARWSAAGRITAPFSMSVNLSARQLAHSDVVALVGAALERTGADPAMLGLEITESVLMGETSVETIAALKALGVKLSIDDFGTGYSSLGYLKRFPVDVVKVDRSFVDGLGVDPEDSAIVAAVISLGHALGLDVVAEGVETERQLAELVRLGCDQAQGYWFAAAAPEEQFLRCVGRLPAVVSAPRAS